MAASSPRSIQHSLIHHPGLLASKLQPNSRSSPHHFLLKTTAVSSTTSSTSSTSSSSTFPTIQLTKPAAIPFYSSRSWVSTLLSTKFYGPCPHHANLRKNDLNLFCTRHAQKICQYCHRDNHDSKPSCTILHVSRYMYHDVLLAKEAAALLDVSDVQSYLNNGNRVVYIDRRAQPKSKLAPHAKACAVCSRTLQDPYRFCSVFCRLAHANDPAAVATLPVPDASPLLHHNIRKTKTVSAPSSPQPQSKRNERSSKRGERPNSRAMSPVTPERAHVKSMSRTTAPPLQLRSISKKSRRKGTPVRSPSLHTLEYLLSHGTCV
ncbi:unnamed protein product [Chondrus crispus]|uniref:B box-type domain-containing protein n=1 Tax=Chondrus crispus TaxID=2769 RepID=R7QRW6_CHOCR|nr:unnamed protein product [Chondrus crispus]CDF40879.1 unnamed protein product [Chondrus crispus]|eukprot:XP_005711173.1 unnamed protein product [Chondrus crispus]